MATAWDRIDDEYRAYLIKSGTTPDEYNHFSFRRLGYLFEFESFKEQVQNRLGALPRSIP
jgi:hypothetical protein